MNSPSPYILTAIVSVYKAEEFLRGCLDDLIAQSIFERVEVLIIDACSPQNEGAIAQEYVQKYPNITYIRTQERESLYASWNRGIKLAKGIYITNANADDRHAPHALERLVAELEAHPEAALAYAKVRITAKKNAHFATAPIKRVLHWIAYDHVSLLRRTEVGPQPVWRKSVHEELGFFNAAYTVAGDYDMWLRMSERYPLRFVPEELGLCLEYDNNLEAQNPQRSHDESCEVKHAAFERFFSPHFSTHTKLDFLQRRYAHKVAGHMKALQTGQDVGNLSDLECHFFGYALLLAKEGKADDALHILDIFFSLISQSKHVAYLYRYLVLHDSAQSPCQHGPLVSVIMPMPSTGEEKHYAENALRSVMAQNYKHWQIYLVCSKEDTKAITLTKELMDKYTPAPINTVYAAGQSTYAALLNKGIEATSAPYICPLPPTGELAPAYLADALQILEKDQALHWVSPKAFAFGRDNGPCWTEEKSDNAVLLHCPYAPASIYRRSLWQKLGGYAAGMTDFEDWDFWTRAFAKDLEGCFTQKVAYVHRQLFIKAIYQPEHYLKAVHSYLQRHPQYFVQMSEKDLKTLLSGSSFGILPQTILK